MPKSKSSSTSSSATFCMWSNLCENKYLCCHFCSSFAKCKMACHDLENCKTCRYATDQNKEQPKNITDGINGRNGINITAGDDAAGADAGCDAAGCDAADDGKRGRKRTSKSEREIKKLNADKELADEFKRKQAQKMAQQAAQNAAKNKKNSHK